MQSAAPGDRQPPARGELGLEAEAGLGLLVRGDSEIDDDLGHAPDPCFQRRGVSSPCHLAHVRGQRAGRAVPGVRTAPNGAVRQNARPTRSRRRADPGETAGEIGGRVAAGCLMALRSTVASPRGASATWGRCRSRRRSLPLAGHGCCLPRVCGVGTVSGRPRAAARPSSFRPARTGCRRAGGTAGDGRGPRAGSPAGCPAHRNAVQR